MEMGVKMQDRGGMYSTYLCQVDGSLPEHWVVHDVALEAGSEGLGKRLEGQR